MWNLFCSGFIIWISLIQWITANANLYFFQCAHNGFIFYLEFIVSPIFTLEACNVFHMHLFIYLFIQPTFNEHHFEPGTALGTEGGKYPLIVLHSNDVCEREISKLTQRYYFEKNKADNRLDSVCVWEGRESLYF